MLVSAIIIYLLITIAIGLTASRFVKNAEDFVLAGRRLPLMLASTAVFATWFGSETVMGASSEFVQHGLLGVIEDPFGASLCLLLVGIFFARPIYRMNILTFGDFYRIKFDQKVELLAGIFMVVSYFGWIAAQLVAMGIIMNVVLGIPLEAGILTSAGIVLLYTYIGGMWSISITDFMQTIIIIAGLLFLLIEISGKAGGLAQVIAQAPADFFRFTPDPEPFAFVEYLAAWITIGLGSIPQQDVFQRVMSARSENVAVRASYVGSLMYLTIAFIPLLIGLSAKVVYPELMAGDPQMVLPQAVLLHSSVLIQVMFFGALLSAIMSTSSGAILAPATILAENVIRPYLPKLSDKQFLRLLRGSVVAISLVSTVLASMRSNIYELVGESSALSLVSLFVPMVAGLYWKKATPRGALLAMLLGMGAWLVSEFAGLEVPSLVPGVIASMVGMVVGSLWKSNQKIERG